MDKIIADTSIWIDFFNGKLFEHVRSKFVSSIENNNIGITDIILHELLMGTHSKRQYQELEDMFGAITQFNLSTVSFSEFNQFAWKVHRLGLPGKYTDLNIAFLAHKHKCPILSFDKYFYKLGKKHLIKIIEF